MFSKRYFTKLKRRSSLLKLCGFLMFIGLVSLWVKSEQDPSKRNHENLLNIMDDKDNLDPKPIVDERVEMPHLAAPAKPIVDEGLEMPKEIIHVPLPLIESEKHKAESLFAVDDAKVVPGLGAGGRAVPIKEEEKEDVEAIMKVEAFNLLLSDKIALNRTVPDSRNPLCKSLSYSPSLPTASVIIIFTNEAWSTLLRTIHSTINMSPEHLLKEIILVDDFSDRDELGEKLNLYIKYRLPTSKIKLVRLSRRQGLIRARIEGAKHATADVLIFLDSHCECNTMWMEPLLARIKESREAVLVPIIDVIDDKTLEYYNGNGAYFQVGGFTWSGHFNWIEVSESEKKRRGSQVSPTRSPTMAGGLFAIDRQFFWDIGSYDEGMDVWGGENLEMSFRVWMCGGTLETIPCSRVGHIFRSFHPYSFPGNKDTHGLNTARVAEVWMDDYKRLFYMHRAELQDADIGDVTDRKNFRLEKKCKSFKWFLDNIFPQKFILDEDSYAYGKVHNLGTTMCLDTLEQEDAELDPYDLGQYDCLTAPLSDQLHTNGSVPPLCFDTLQADEKNQYFMGLYPCHDFLGSSQYMSLSHKGELRRETVCAAVTDAFTDVEERKVRMVRCHGNGGDQQWILTKSGHILHQKSNLCLDSTGKSAMSHVTVSKCSNVASQQWVFDHYNIH